MVVTVQVATLIFDFFQLCYKCMILCNEAVRRTLKHYSTVVLLDITDVYIELFALSPVQEYLINYC